MTRDLYDDIDPHFLPKTNQVIFSSNRISDTLRIDIGKADRIKDQYDLFRSLTPPVEVIGISQDTVEQHKEFKEELQLPFTLLSDPERKVAVEFGVANHLGLFPAKSSFLIGPDNTIHHVYDWLFRPRTHVAKILSAMSEVTDGARFK